ncbi:MAG: hypothetical protein AAFX45_06725 [Pseudomonadota bacterium]
MLGLLAVLFGFFAVGAGGSGAQGGSQPLSADDADRIAEAEEDYAVEDAAAAFYAADGQLVLEAESGEANGHWSKVSVDGETGMLWDAEKNSYNTAQAGQELSFDFVTQEGGDYFIALHAGRFQSAQDPGDVRSDTGNDAWVKVTNLETGEVVLDPIKLFTGLGEADRELKWGNTFDENHVKSSAKVSLEADTGYRLELIGRSDGHVIDRITLSNDGVLRDTEVEESLSLMEALTITDEEVFASAGPEGEIEETEELDLI